MAALKSEEKEISDSPISPEQIAELADLVIEGELTGKLAKQVFPKMFETGDSAPVVMKREGLEQISDTGELAGIIDDVLAKSQAQVEQYRP